MLFSAIFLFAEKKTNVLLEQCEELSFDKQNGRPYQVLRGNVRFRHEDVLMYCDSAYFYDGSNSFDAFGHVRVVQNSDMSLSSDSMFYDGNARMMRVRGSVVLNSGSSNLHTHYLDYNREKNFGYYFGGGEVVDQSYHLTSFQGYYYPDSKSYLFKDTVVLVHPDYTIHADSLRYNQNSGNAVVLGPSIIKGNTYTVHTTRGYVNTNTNKGKLYNRSVVYYKNGRRMTADSIYFDSNRGSARAFQNAEVQDSSQKMIMRGNYMDFDRSKPSYGIVTNHAYVIDYSDKDSMFMRADTFYYCEMVSTLDELRAYHDVRLYRKDMQGKCDSLVYFVQDSMARMYVNPVLWSEDNQLTGDTAIEIYVKHKSPERIRIPSKAFIVSDEGYGQFNQLSGKEANAYIEHNKLRKIELMGDAQSLYYSKDDYGYFIGLNKATGPSMTIYTKNKKLDKIIMTPESEGIMYPPEKIPDDERFLKNYQWRESDRPKSKDEIIAQ